MAQIVTFQTASMMCDVQTRLRSTVWANSLKASGYRMTQPRRAVLAVLEDAQDEALAIKQIWEKARRLCPMLGKATVYRMLERMEALGFVRRIYNQRGSHIAVAIVTIDDSQGPFLVCIRCGRIQPVSATVTASLSEQLLHDCGFQVAVTKLEIPAICPGCR